MVGVLEKLRDFADEEDSVRIEKLLEAVCLSLVNFLSIANIYELLILEQHSGFIPAARR